LSGRGLCDELITRPEESFRLWCVVCDLETSRIGAPYIYIYIYDSSLKVKSLLANAVKITSNRACAVPNPGLLSNYIHLLISLEAVQTRLTINLTYEVIKR